MLLSKVNGCQLLVDRMLTRSFENKRGLAMQLQSLLRELASLASQAEQELGLHREFVAGIETDLADCEGERRRDGDDRGFQDFIDSFDDEELVAR